MANRKSISITCDSITQEIAVWIKQEEEGGGAWSMFVLHTLKDLKRDYRITMEYLSAISKEQFDFVCDAIEEVVYHFQKEEMVDLIEALYAKFYGEEKNTELYRENIAGLRNCIRKK